MDTSSRPRVPSLTFGALFGACLLAAWAWFNTDAGCGSPELRRRSVSVWLSTRTNLPGYTFVPEHVSDSVKRALGTTNILSGTFYKSETWNQALEVNSDQKLLTSDKPLQFNNSHHSSGRTTVFVATWPTGNKSGLGALQHSPDICWGSAGWKEIDLGQPKHLIVELLASEDQVASASSVPLRFECSAFEFSHSGSRELVIWSKLLGGSSLEVFVGLFSVSSTLARRIDSNENRLGALERFGRLASLRSHIYGPKQFVRFSNGTTSNPSLSLSELQAFASQCLSVQTMASTSSSIPTR